jgi:hypothetical protein
MSAKNKVNPDHYKTGHPGMPREAPPPDAEAAVKRRKKAAEDNFIPGAAPVGETEEREEG